MSIFALDGCQSLDVTGPFEVFQAASELIREQRRRLSPYSVSLVSLRAGKVRTESGLVLHASHGVRTELARGAPDTLLVTGGLGMRRAARLPDTVAAVRSLAEGARRIGSVCTGAFVLGAAGILDGRKATTHWAFCDALARDYPRVTVERSPIFVRDSQVWTSAGVTAGIDLALCLVEQDCGRELAALVARWLVVFVRRAGGQSQFSAQLATLSTEREPLRDLMAWIGEHPELDLQVPTLASRVGMSTRHFSRVFQREVGTSPAAYVEAVRLEAARRLLEGTPHSVEEVARRSGFDRPEGLRRAMSRRIGLSPSEYRARFGTPSS